MLKARMHDNAVTFPSSQPDKKQSLDQSLNAAMPPYPYEGGRWAILISFLALALSLFSLYETVLKSADPQIHLGSVVHYARDFLQPADVFAVPLTITNSGAREAVIIELRLQVADAAPESIPVPMSGLYSGTNPRTDRTPFTPISIPGHGDFHGMVLFYRDDADGRQTAPIVTGNQDFRFCLTARTAPGGGIGPNRVVAPKVSFDAKVVAFSGEVLSQGKTIQLRLKPSGAEVNSSPPAESRSNCP
jgi:hypothetical protein